MLKSRRKKNEETKRRFEAIKDLMSTFAMSTVAVVAAVTLIPASPKAEITKAVALNEEIIYQVKVTDEDNALDISTLSVVIENQLEFYEQSISLGESSGYFDNLENDTQYRLSVYGNKGFGQERLDTLMITTKAKLGAMILSVIPETNQHSTSYSVDLAINDPNSLYTSVKLYYGYKWEHNSEIEYSSIDVTSSRMTIELFDIFTLEPFHIYLEATTSEGTQLLDEIWVTPPFELYAFIYMEYITNNKASFSVYSDMDVGNISYQMNIYKNKLLIRTDQITLEESNYEDKSFVIEHLSPNTNYTFECIALYTNPQTLRKEESTIYKEEITTLGDYLYTYHIDEIDDYIEVTIVLDDPLHNFQYAYYEVYDTSDEFNMYIDGETYPFTANMNDKSTSFIISLPSTSSYQIIIGIRNQNDFTIKEIIDTITFE